MHTNIHTITNYFPHRLYISLNRHMQTCLQKCLLGCMWFLNFLPVCFSCLIVWVSVLEFLLCVDIFRLCGPFDFVEWVSDILGSFFKLVLESFLRTPSELVFGVFFVDFVDDCGPGLLVNNFKTARLIDFKGDKKISCRGRVQVSRTCENPIKNF